jgi:hypothetical protein
MSPRYRSKPKPPASGEEAGDALAAPPARSFGPSPGFGPESRAHSDPSLGGGAGGHRSSQGRSLPPVQWNGDHPAPPKLKQEI